MSERFPEGSVALVTGASRGLGAAVAVELARLGAHVVLTARTQGGLEETDDAIRAIGGAATLLALDLREPTRIDAIGPTLYQRFGRLDALVHCSAVLGKLTPVAHIQPEDWNEVVAVNMTAAWRVIRTCDPLLRHGPSGRAVFATDSRAGMPEAYWGPYGASKAAMAHLALSWAAEVATTNLRVNLFDPGPMRTRLRSQAFPGAVPESFPPPEDAAPTLAAMVLASEVRNGAVVAMRA